MGTVWNGSEPDASPPGPLLLTWTGIVYPLEAAATVRFERFLVCALALIASAAQPLSGEPTVSLRGALDQYCVGCHNDSAKTADLALDRVDPADPSKDREIWEAVIHKLRHRQMPPIGLPRPGDDVYDGVIGGLAAGLDREAEEHPNPGRTATFRRLTRTEYRNAIRDLLHLDLDVAELLPRDESSGGFDNITVGELSPTLLESYLGAARKISRLAVGGAAGAPGGATILIPPELTQERHMTGLPLGTRGGAAVSHTFPLDAEYEISVRLSRNRDEQVEGLREPHRMELALGGERLELFTVTRPEGRDYSLVDQHLVTRVPVSAGPREITATFLPKTSALIETERQPYMARFNMDRHPRIQPAVYSVSIVGPYEASGPGDTPSRRRIFSCSPEDRSDEDGCAKEVLSNLLRRAYRRPVTEADLAAPLRFFKQGSEDTGFEAGIQMALRAVLVNPQFLFRIERDPAGVAPNAAYQVSDIELASRLSFFLWSSIPDDELLDAAVNGKLSQPESLERQVQRMLADKRSKALVDSFAAQWLYLRNLESVSPDRRLFPDFDENLRRAFRRETEMLFESVAREDRNVLDLLRADYTFVNERLAKHYDIPHIYGNRFRRVDLGPDSRLGGLLGHGSMLSVTSFANRTSPVVRGKWVLTNILGAPPDPPGPDVPPLKEKGPAVENLTLRERIAEHRDNPVCASCHNIMDPVGFALENYDAIGRWRTKDGAFPVDASGTLADGTSFNGPREFRDALLKRPDLFVTTVSEKLLTYALGRGLEAYDRPAVRKIVSEAAGHEYRFSELIGAVTRSTPFRMRKSL